MRPKELQCVVTFRTTTEAMQLEETAREAGFGGRLIPVPREISAGCGLAWKEAMASRMALEALMAEKKLGYDSIYEIVI
ncbi:hypothetical protein HNQ56_002776 [Anaerotaenia torta]|uniref:DUF3343 domain-containing protein n=1 Tax=Anaerotaenia torta TaxID=433293 RepID=UPI003D235710